MSLNVSSLRPRSVKIDVVPGIYEKPAIRVVPKRLIVCTRCYNASCEGFSGRLKNDTYYHRDWSRTNVHDFAEEVDEFIRRYNQQRIKMSLGAMSPAEYRVSLGIVA